MKQLGNDFQDEDFPKSLTGIQGLDEITNGGLPKGRPTLVCGSAGSGKTLLAMEFLIHGATQFNEPGVFMAFEETDKELIANVRSLAFDLEKLIKQKKILLDYVYIERSEIEETGEYDLEGLFIRLNHAIDSIGAKRVVLDTIESLFSGLPNPLILRAELRRLFRWLKEKGVTAIITGERGDNTLTRQGLEEYVSDCVLLLDHRIVEQISTRRLRVVKYRGSSHGTNEFPFFIAEHGLSILPVTSLKLNHSASIERISSGIARLDSMLEGKGFHRGSTILVSGTAGTGKTSIAALFTDAACQRGERVLYFSFEESPSQIMRNMRSIGLNLELWLQKGLLQLHSARPSFYGLENHLSLTWKIITDYEPQVVILDPISAFNIGTNELDVKMMLLRLVDLLKTNQTTTLMTNLTKSSDALERTEAEISSIIDTWLLVRDIEIGGERNRGIYILKSRGTANSNQIREFRLTAHGIELLDVYVGADGVLTGSARLSQEAKEKAERLLLQQEVEIKQRALERNRAALEAKIASLKAEYETQESELIKQIERAKAKYAKREQDRDDMGKSRKIDLPLKTTTIKTKK